MVAPVATAAIDNFEDVEEQEKLLYVLDVEVLGLYRVDGMCHRGGNSSFLQKIPELVNVFANRLDLLKLGLLQAVHKDVRSAAILWKKRGDLNARKRVLGPKVLQNKRGCHGVVLRDGHKSHPRAGLEKPDSDLSGVAALK